MRYTRMFAGADGESHFEDLQPAELGGEHGAAVLLSTAAARAVLVRLPRHFDQPWVGEAGTLAALLAGEIDVTMSDGETRRFGPGAVFHVEDALLLLVRLPEREEA